MQRCWKQTEIVNVSFFRKIYQISSFKNEKIDRKYLAKDIFLACYEQRSRIVGNPKSPCRLVAIIRVKCMMGLLNLRAHRISSSKKADITNIEPTIFYRGTEN